MNVPISSNKSSISDPLSFVCVGGFFISGCGVCFIAGLACAVLQ